MNELLWILETLNKKQQEVCISESNIVLTACPGSGKTRTITHRLAYLAEKYRESYKYNVAITYTNRAAIEIESRIDDMGIDTKNIWTGTIHQFCMHFIIRPYSMYHPRLSKGYKVIDEYVKEKRFQSIAEDLNMSDKFIDELYENVSVINAYNELLNQNKEIDFDSILSLSNELLESNNFISENIGGIIRSIHVDEYQDTNELQYTILSQLVVSNKSLNILFVGDVNQAIYRNLGGVAKTTAELEQFFLVNFEEKILDGCYRSTQRLVEYYSNFEVQSTGASACGNYKMKMGNITYNQTIQKEDLVDEIVGIVRSYLDSGVPQNEICIIAPQWQSIYHLVKKIRVTLPTVSFDAPDMSPIKYDPLNVFFLIAKLVFTKMSGRALVRRKEASMILEILGNEYNFSIPSDITKLDVLQTINATPIQHDDGIGMIHDAIKNVLKLINITMDTELQKSYDLFFEKSNNRIKQHDLQYNYFEMEKCFKEKKGIVISTIHGVKGEEHETVIAFSLLNGRVPHWNYIIKDELKAYKVYESNKMLYVLASRSKMNLHLFSERGYLTKNKQPYLSTEELKKYKFDYDVNSI